LAIQCPACGRQYDVTLFQFGKSVPCSCGGRVDAHRPHSPPSPLHLARERERLSDFQRRADLVSSMVLDDDLPWVDVAIAIERLRDLAEEWVPGRGDFFQMVYESRFERLRQQFRPAD
jgi:hypothetical protein